MSDPNSSQGTKPVILLVEDEKESAMLFTLAVKRRLLDVEIDHTLSGMTALKKLNQRKYDLLVTDLFFPDMDGVSLIHAVRKAGHELPIIILTGRRARIGPRIVDLSLGESDGLKLETSLFNGYLYKAFHPSDLARLLRNVLTGQPGPGWPSDNEMPNMLWW